MPETDQQMSFAYALVNRVVPWLNGQVHFGHMEKRSGEADAFELCTRNGVLHIHGSSSSAVGFGLNYYLKYFCHRSLSHCGNHLIPPPELPAVDEPLRITTPHTFRYALNYCTFNYTMAFWTWEQWERELDWMILNGVNLMLLMTGTKAVWYELLKKYAYSEKEIHEFLPGPVYNAWWLMGNLEGWGGLASAGLINQQVELTRRILQRMREMEIEPVFEGFYGMVPRSMKQKFPDMPISVQGLWNEVFERPDLLKCSSPLFRRMGLQYYDICRELYGEFRFFAGDPFHEGGSTQGIDVAEEARAIEELMQEAVPGSTWVLQAWYTNPKPELLSGIGHPENILILDLFGEVTREWEERDAFGGFPFVWCSINNFGERPGLYGRLERLAGGPLEAYNSRYRPLMKGIGAAPEGIANNPVVYDLIFDSAWRPEEWNTSSWIREYTHYRYGTAHSAIEEAWSVFLETAYQTNDKYQEGPSESVFCARPSIKVTSASTWGTRYLYYDTERFEEAARLFASAGPEFRMVDSYRFDVVDITRQVVANRGQWHYDEMIKAFTAGNNLDFQYHSQAFLQLILLQDELLATHPDFMLGRWLREAWNFRDDKTEKYLCDWNARVLITYWGPDNPRTPLHDYACKEWSGLLKDFYYPRWKMFIEELNWELMEMEHVELNYFSFEAAWANQHKEYPVLPSGDCIRKSREILKKLQRSEYATTLDY